MALGCQEAALKSGSNYNSGIIGSALRADRDAGRQTVIDASGGLATY